MSRPKGSKNKPKMDENGNPIVKETKRTTRTRTTTQETENTKTVEAVQVTEPDQKEPKTVNIKSTKEPEDTDLLHIKNSKININKAVRTSYASICQKCMCLKTKKCEGIIPHPNMPEITTCPSYIDEESIWE
jgi:hypothetical protein